MGLPFQNSRTPQVRPPHLPIPPPKFTARPSRSGPLGHDPRDSQFRFPGIPWPGPPGPLGHDPWDSQFRFPGTPWPGSPGPCQSPQVVPQDPQKNVARLPNQVPRDPQDLQFRPSGPPTPIPSKHGQAFRIPRTPNTPPHPREHGQSPWDPQFSPLGPPDQAPMTHKVRLPISGPQTPQYHLPGEPSTPPGAPVHPKIPSQDPWDS